MSERPAPMRWTFADTLFLAIVFYAVIFALGWVWGYWT